MGTKSTLGEDSDRPDDDQCDEWLVEVNDDSTRQHTNNLIRGSFGPGHEQPGIFFDSANRLAQSEGLPFEEDDVNQETDDFHDSDAEDIYDLYLAVNGVLDGDLLDVRRLDDLSPDEAKILNVPRLREIWKHTATGCPTCYEIIKTLNIVRNVLREDANDETTAESVAVDQVDSILH